VDKGGYGDSCRSVSSLGKTDFGKGGKVASRLLGLNC